MRQTPLLSIAMRIPVPWVFVLVYLVGLALEHLVPLRITSLTSAAVPLCGGVLFLTGVFVAGWGWLTFRRSKTTTVPGRISSRLVNWGPYRFSRNPMYLGLTLAYMGEAGLLRQVWPVVLLPIVLAYLNWGVIRVEEGKLEQTFPQQYADYRAQVRRWI